MGSCEALFADTKCLLQRLEFGVNNLSVGDHGYSGWAEPLLFYSPLNILSVALESPPRKRASSLSSTSPSPILTKLLETSSSSGSAVKSTGEMMILRLSRWFSFNHRGARSTLF